MMTRYLFFSGKGGVGKTTMASASAIHYAMNGNKTLIVTTDPASNLADVFEQEIGHKITPIKGIQNLWAMEIEPDKAAKEYKEKIIGPYREIMPEDVIASLEENLSGPCTTEMAAFDRFIDFMEGDEYDIIVFDTAPTGHTIRLLQLPVDWSKHIQEAASGSGQTCLGPVQTIQDSKDKYDRATALLKDTVKTTFIFVMRPEELSLYETQRASRELETIGINSGELIINGILPEEVCGIGFFRKKYDAQQNIVRKAESIINKPKQYMLLRDNEVKGLKALQSVADELFNNRKPSFHFGIEHGESADVLLEKPDIESLWLPGNTPRTAKSGAPLFTEGMTKSLFFTGKGGVGKTTISCIAALFNAQKGYKTLLVTTDPAAHIGEVLNVKVGAEPAKVTDNLYAVMVDQKAAFKEYKEKVLGEAKGKYSDDMLAAMDEELNSPCTEEMAAFDKFIQFIESNDYQTVVFDTAPTGHTLRLLELPFDYAKQVEMMAGTGDNLVVKDVAQNRFKKIIQTLRDQDRTVFAFVLYPESTPILESYRAMVDLRNAGINTQLIVANLILTDRVCINDFFKNRQQMQMKYLAEIKQKFDLPVLQFPLMQDEIKGFDLLKKAVAIL
ncbi:MAG: TRC40/GET3/ArsA family transport-energizing ATPase [Deltaproteobacteria bacterium]|nr:TRC40/GET3/ArsA family transport-energizing ATPase [Deltaproteobacteria bacterium]MCL5792754.1 TRC40/GET3/ArsA family transport-energizing ATPase [Deltaproteobacteria bacterium]